MSEKCICELKEGEDVDLCHGGWTVLKMLRRNGITQIVASGDDEVYYMPIYCPECGKILDAED